MEGKGGGPHTGINWAMSGLLVWFLVKASGVESEYLNEGNYEKLFADHSPNYAKATGGHRQEGSCDD